jgi:hypothetical protein
MKQRWRGLGRREIEEHDLLADFCQREHSVDLGRSAHDQQAAFLSLGIIVGVEDDVDA